MFESILFLLRFFLNPRLIHARLGQHIHRQRADTGDNCDYLFDIHVTNVEGRKDRRDEGGNGRPELPA